MPAHKVVGVIAMWNRLVAAAGSMLMLFVVTTAIMSGRARCRITRVDTDHVLINMAFMQVVHVSLVEVVRMSFVFNRSVSATRAVLMRMAVVLVACHDLLPSDWDTHLGKCADPLDVLPQEGDSPGLFFRINWTKNRVQAGESRYFAAPSAQS
jgi:hypothetical protein